MAVSAVKVAEGWRVVLGRISKQLCEIYSLSCYAAYADHQTPVLLVSRYCVPGAPPILDPTLIHGGEAIIMQVKMAALHFLIIAGCYRLLEEFLRTVHPGAYS